jgi:hypothetical protein
VSPDEAKQVLLLYRPETSDAEDPEVIQAMEVARGDRDLARWFENHCAFQRAMRAGFARIEAPAHLKLALLAGPKIVPLRPWWRRPAWFAAAAAVALVFGLLSLRPAHRVPDRFADFRAMMVSKAIREYRMDFVTPDMGQLRKQFARRGAPADYEVIPGLENLSLTGGGLLAWRDHPVSMVCFEKRNKQMLFLFVMRRDALKDPPPSEPQLAKVSIKMTASWSRGDKTYVLAGSDEPGFGSKYF